MIKHLWIKWIVDWHGKDLRTFWHNAWTFPKHFYQFIKEVCSFLKNGYPYEAIYNHYNYLINMEINMLKEYLRYHHGYPGEHREEGGRTDEEWEATIQHMISLLERMAKEDNAGIIFTDIIKYNKETEQVTKEFFELFNKWFYDLWD